jgi:hypothetical protein
MDTYAAYYNREQPIVIESDSAYHAKLEAIRIWKVRPSQQHMISIVHDTHDGIPITHLPLF